LQLGQLFHDLAVLRVDNLWPIHFQHGNQSVGRRLIGFGKGYVEILMTQQSE
jgi:hypothetical protein